MKSSVFSFKSYKSVMAEWLTGKEQRGQLSRAAEFMNCQRSFLSRVITEEMHLTPDQAFKLVKFWKLGHDEAEYFQLLVSFERAGDPEYRESLKLKVADLKKKYESIQERTQRKNLTIESLHTHYFSNWVWTALHFLVAVPEYQTAEALADRLGLKKDIVLMYLKQLEAQGLVVQVKNKWNYRSGEFHVPKDSPLVVLHHQNWRGRAVLDSQEFNNSSVHFTGVLTMSRSDIEKVKSLLLDFISEANRIAAPSSPEDAVALTCDLFKI